MNNITPEINIYSVSGLIENTLKQFLMQIDPELNYMNLTKIKTNTFKAGLYYVYDNVFRVDDPRYLLDKTRIDKDDIPLLLKITDCYIRLCDYYNKQLGLFGFSCLTGISIDEVRSWGQNATSPVFQVYKNLRDHMKDSSEECLKDSDIGRIAVANNSSEAGLNYGYAAAAQQAAAAAPKLENIASRYGKPPAITD